MEFCIGIYSYDKAIKSGKMVIPVIKRDRYLLIASAESICFYNGNRSHNLLWIQDEDYRNDVVRFILIEFTETIHFN